MSQKNDADNWGIQEVSELSVGPFFCGQYSFIFQKKWFLYKIL